MDDPVKLYDGLRHFADSWGLVGMMLVFLAAILWAFRPGSDRHYSAAAQLPFKHDDKPATDRRKD